MASNAYTGDYSLTVSASPLEPGQSFATILEPSVSLPADPGQVVPFDFTVTRTDDLSSAASLDYSVEGLGSIPADVTDFSDGALPQGTVSFAAGSAGATIEVEAVGSATTDSAREFAITLSNPSVGLSIDQNQSYGFIDETSALACFASDTTIATKRGDIAVQNLVLGDRIVVVTVGGHATAEVVWIGHRTIDLERQRYGALLAPIRIRAGAIADGVPARDVYLSPDHAIFAEARLIPIKLLVNNGSIAPDRNRRIVTYFHVELASHAILLADGLPCESYLDTGNRAAFANHSMPDLYPDFGPKGDWPRRAAAPLIIEPELVKPVWDRLAVRSAGLGLGRFVPTEDAPDRLPRLGVDGSVIVPLRIGSGVFFFGLPVGCRSVRLISRSFTPAANRPWEDDRRRLGLCVSRLTLRTPDGPRAVPLDHPGLATGWWSPEGCGPRCRWTDGDAEVPVDPDAVALEVVVVPLETERVASHHPVALGSGSTVCYPPVTLAA
ncbi:MAG: Hint domain-containing protein [Acetobacteraceae bacterium]